MAAGAAFATEGGVAAGAGGGGGLLEGFTVKMNSKFGSALTDMDKFNKQWDKLGKTLQPAVTLWNKFSDVFGKVLGGFKQIIAPLAIVGGLFFAFMLAGQVGQDLFGAFGDILGAFSDIMSSQLAPIFIAIYHILIDDLLPVWKQLWLDPAVKTAIQNITNLFKDPAFIAAVVSIAHSLADIAVQFAKIFAMLSPAIMEGIVGFFQAVAAVLVTIDIALKSITDSIDRVGGGLGNIANLNPIGAGIGLGGAMLSGFSGISGTMSSLGGVSSAPSGGGGININLGPTSIIGTDQRSVDEFTRKIMEALRTAGITNVNNMR
jgi:hypothetical protein